MNLFPSPPPPMYPCEPQRRRHSLLDSEAVLTQAKKLKQWKESLHRSPYPTPLGLTKEDCAVEEESEGVEEGASAELDSEASFESTIYDYDEDDGSSQEGDGEVL